MPVEDRSNYTLPARVLYRLGRVFLDSMPGKLVSLFVSSLYSLFSDRSRLRTDFRQIVLQAYFTGIEAIPMISLVSTLLGAITIIQALTVMPRVGFGDFFGKLMVIVIIRELGPILTAFLVAGRTGSALAAYVGNMKVESEIDALETMGINPVRYLVMPALVGGILALLMLNILFSSLSVVVGFLVAKLVTWAFQDYFTIQLLWEFYLVSILRALSPLDFIMIFAKPVVFGAIITTTACYFATSISNDVREVPKATSRSVVYSFLFIVLSNLLMSMAYIFEYLNAMAGVI